MRVGGHPREEAVNPNLFERIWESRKPVARFISEQFDSLRHAWNENLMTSLCLCALALRLSVPSARFVIHFEKKPGNEAFFVTGEKIKYVIMKTLKPVFSTFQNEPYAFIESTIGNDILFTANKKLLQFIPNMNGKAAFLPLHKQFKQVQSGDGQEVFFAKDRVFRYLVGGSAIIRFLAAGYIRQAYNGNTSGNLHAFLFGNITQFEKQIIQAGTIISILSKLSNPRQVTAELRPLKAALTRFTNFKLATANSNFLSKGSRISANKGNSSKLTTILRNFSFITAAHMGWLMGYLAARSVMHLYNQTRLALGHDVHPDILEAGPAIERRVGGYADNNQQDIYHSGLLNKIKNIFKKIFEVMYDGKKELENFATACEKKKQLCIEIKNNVQDFVEAEHKMISATVILGIFTACFAPSTLCGLIIRNQAYLMRRLFTPTLMASIYLRTAQNFVYPIPEDKLINNLKNIGSKKGVCIASLGLVAHLIRQITDRSIRFKGSPIPYILPLITAAATGKMLADSVILTRRKINEILLNPAQVAPGQAGE